MGRREFSLCVYTQMGAFPRSLLTLCKAFVKDSKLSILPAFFPELKPCASHFLLGSPAWKFGFRIR